MSEHKSPVSPIGTLIFGSLHEPSIQFNELGEYFAVLAFSPEDAMPLIDHINTALEGFRQANTIAPKTHKALPYKKMVDDDGKETGEYSFKFSLRAKLPREGKEPLNFKPALFDASALPTTTPVGKGATLKIAYIIRPWFRPGVGYGVILRLRAAQILSLKAPVPFKKDKDVQYYGFEPQGNPKNDATSQVHLTDVTFSDPSILNSVEDTSVRDKAQL